MSAHQVADQVVVPIGTGLLNPLEAECLRRLVPVRFGVYSSTDRIIGTLRNALAHGLPVTPGQRMTLYKICWRYRDQIGDMKFVARVVIAKELLEESLDVAELIDQRVYARAWRAKAPPAQREPLEP